MCSLNGPVMGAGYALTSLVIAFAAFELGRRPTEAMLSEVKVSPLHWTWRIGTDENRQKMLLWLAGIVIVSLLKVSLAGAVLNNASGSCGFVSIVEVVQFWGVGGAAVSTHSFTITHLCFTAAIASHCHV